MSDIIIKLSLLPEKLRPTQGVGGAPEIKERHIPDNEGLSILRQNREVFWGRVPYWPVRGFFKEIDRWWGCEISFHPKLDRAFTVKNIKRGAVPEPTLKKTIYDKIKPTVHKYREEIQEVWEAAKLEKARNDRSKADGYDTGHSGAEGVAKKVKGTTENVHVSPDNPEESQRELAKRLHGQRTKKERAAILSKWKEQPYTFEEDRWKSPEFFEIKPLGGSDVIILNKSHPFIEKYLEYTDKLKNEVSASDAILLGEYLRRSIDLMIVTFAKAKSKFMLDTPESETLFEEFIMNWSMFLKSYVNNVEYDEVEDREGE